jgi:hypothetical protein
LSLVIVVGPVSAATIAHPVVAQAAQAVSLSGQVVDIAGKPIGKAAVTVEGSGLRKSTTTDANGAFSIDVPPGEYTITVNHGGYQTGSSDVVVSPGAPLTVNVALTESNLSNLQVIGRTSTNLGGNTGAKFNISSSAQSTLSAEQITIRDVPNLAPVVNELPGININHSASNPNQYFTVHGFSVEVKNTLDGHPVSSGTGGTFLTQFMQAGIFGGVDVEKGMGLNGPTAGQSGVATVNLRTPDFTAKNSAYINGGLDSYAGGLYNALVDLNFLKDNRLSLIVGKSLTGYAGPTHGYDANAIYSSGAIAGYNGTYAPPAQLTNSTIAFQNDFSNSYNLNAELAKLRYKFSDATSLTLEFIGFQGRWDPQGGAYGQFEGFATIPQCTNNKVAASGAACGPTSVYNAPSAQGLIGQSNVPLYTFYPGSDVRQNQPNFNADFKTTLGNDTILFRPYAAGIRRLIDGTNESSVPGDNGGWYEVTNPAYCTVESTPASAANGGAKGPCYLANSGVNAPGYVNDPNTPHSFTTLPASQLPAGACTAANPCYTNLTAQNNAGIYGFGAPYTTLEVDKLFGYTFSYIHPVGVNIFSASIDHYYDDTSSFVNDYSPLIAGCQFVASGGTLPALASGLGSQPTCTGLNGLYRPSPIQVPETFSSITDISFTGQFQLRDNLEFDWGNYFTHYLINGQQVNPTLVNAYEVAGVNPTYITVPQNLVGVQNAHSHYDPHFGLVYRATHDLAIRLNGGSSISIPYASQVSGFTQAQQGAQSTTITQPNANLLPETIVAYDLGADYRAHNGTIVSGDLFSTLVHNPWIASKIVLANGPLPGLEQTAITYGSQQLNGAQRISQGVELTVANEPHIGFGYRVTGTLDRTYYGEQPASLFLAAPQTYFNGNQTLGVPYTRSYAEIQYAGIHNSLIRLGMDYEGNNNEYNYPAFVVFDAGARVQIGNGYILGISGENITGVNLNANLGAGVANQGSAPVAQQINAAGVTSYGTSGVTGVVQPGFRTYRFTLSKRF